MDGIKALSGLAWSHDILTGKRPIPTFNKNEKKDKGFQGVLDKAMEGKSWMKETAKSASITS